MTCGIQATGAIELFFYGELPAADRASVEGHLRTCAECRRALDELTMIRAALVPRPDEAMPPGGDWSAFMARLDASVQASRHGGIEPAGGASPGRILSLPSRRQLAPYLAMAALVTLVTSGVLLVVLDRDTDILVAPAGAPATESAREELGSAAAVRLSVADTVQSPAVRPGSVDPALVSVSDRHFERSKLVVLGLTTMDPSTAAEEDWAHERALATSLLSDTRLYRQAAEERGMEPLAGVLEDLELVLLQTAMAEERDAASLERLQRLIRRRDLLTKMTVVQAGGRE
jgi:hypothetical protein